MSSLEYLNLGEYYENISFSQLKRLNYLEFGKITILEKKQKVENLYCENLLRNCVIVFDSIRIEKNFLPFPILSESGAIISDKIGSLFEIIALKLNELGVVVAGVKFAFVSEKYIYVSFNRQSMNKRYSYPSFILFESELPNTILEHRRSHEKKEEFFDFKSSIEYLLELKNYSPKRKCEIQ